MRYSVRELLQRAYAAASMSPDPSNQNGALVVNDNYDILSQGCNEFPPAMQRPTYEQLHDRDWKLANIEHAERFAIFNAVAHRVKVPGRILICPWVACHDCAKAITLTGIKRVICHQQRMNETPERWVESVRHGLKIMEDGGVVIEYFSGRVGGPPIIVNGKLLQL